MKVYNAKDVEVWVAGVKMKGFACGVDITLIQYTSTSELDLIANGDPTDQVTFGVVEDVYIPWNESDTPC